MTIKFIGIGEMSPNLMKERVMECLKINKQSGQTAFGQPRKRLLCWLKEHNSHGLEYTPVYLPEGDEPELGEWIRAKWLDEPSFTKDG